MKPLFVFKEQGGAFLQPDQCGSAVQWNAYVKLEEVTYGDKKGSMSPSMSGTVNLCDCSRWISCDASSEQDLEKLDNAIKELKKIRKALKKALEVYEEHGGE